MSEQNRPPASYVDALSKRGFVLDDWLGGGAYGNVYRAEQLTLKRPVAVKFFDTKFMKGAANRKRFDREAPLLARVQHPSVPYVITTGTFLHAGHEIPYSVLQYIAGKSLDKLITRGTALEMPVVLNVMRSLASALQAAHQLKVVHRDVKPDNLIVADRGTYLIDFSIGVSLEHETGLTRATKDGERVGTMDYAAPEQLKNSATVDHRADIYSASVVFAEMLGARVRLELSTLDRELAAVPQEIRDIIRRGAAESREDRYQHTTEFLAAIERLAVPTWMPHLLEPQTVLCRNPKCPGAAWSDNGYYRGPRVLPQCRDRYCAQCGGELLRACAKCHRPFPANIGDLVVKKSKRQPDPLRAFCVQCGTVLFATPTCAHCGSYLSADEIESDTKKTGCKLCSRRLPAPPAPAPSEVEPAYFDDDVPF